MSRRGLAWACAGAALLCACKADSGARTQVMVVIDAQPQVRAQTTDVDVEVRSGMGPVAEWDRRLLQSITPGDDIGWPLELALVPKDGDADRVFLVIATARDADGEAVAQVRAISGYQAGKTLALLLLFEDTCLDKAELCGEEQTCRRGGCVDARVEPGDLPDYARDDAGEPVIVPYWPDAGSGGSAGAAGASGSGGERDAGTDAGPVPPGGDCASDDDCDDGDPCDGAEQCEGGACQDGEPFECPEVDQPCLRNVCVDDGGEPSCETRNADEGETCRDGDESDEAEDRCALDYVCVEGACEPQTEQDCDPGQCRTRAGCDPEDGCLFDDKSSSTECDDGDDCTQDDTCDGDGACEGEAYSCDDSVDCTVDVCDGEGGCTHEPSDELCSGPCKSGTCDAVMDCLAVTFSQDFVDCEDGEDATDGDMCYLGECLGGRERAPTASCEVAGCGCDGFSTVRDLEYNTGSETFVGLIDATQSGEAPCTTGSISIVYEVSRSALTAFTTDTDYGAIAETGADLGHGFVVSSAHIGELDPAARSVDWLDTELGNLVDAQTIASYRGLARHTEGSVLGNLETHYWIWGADSGTSSTSRVVRCSSCSSLEIMGCNTPLSCTSATGYVTSSIARIVPYTYPGALLTTNYGGVLQVVNLPSGTARRRIYEDGVTQDYAATGLQVEEDDGLWGGALRTSTSGQVLVHGSGTNNLRLCTDDDNDGDTSCSVISGLPNQSVRNYTRSVMGSGSTALLMLANTGSSYYLVLLPSGLDPSVGANWREILLASSGTTANAVAASPEQILVLGKSGANVPYVWSWAR